MYVDEREEVEGREVKEKDAIPSRLCRIGIEASSKVEEEKEGVPNPLEQVRDP